MKACGEFVSKVLLARDKAHMAHWAAKGEGSYARHVALGKFYEDVLDLIDGFVEQYQGAYNTRIEVKLSKDDGDDIETELLFQSAWIEVNRNEICEKTDTPLQNTIDEIVRVYQHTLYLLTLK